MRSVALPVAALSIVCVLPAYGQRRAREFARDSVAPYLSFPEPGLDDPAAYEGYTTRVFRDSRDNAFQVYVNGATGRVVNLWADALDESVGFTVRDSGGKPAEVAWGTPRALVADSLAGRMRSLSYGLEAPGSVSIGLFLLGSMRVERDLQYARRDTLPLDAAPFPQHELTELIDHIARLKPNERARHLAVLGLKTIDALRARLTPHIALEHTDTTWAVRVEQPSFDGKHHLRLDISGDSRETAPTLTGSVVTIRRAAGGIVRINVRVSTDAPALTPLSRAEIFNDDFRRFYDAVRADTGGSHAERFRRLEREVRGMEVLCFGEKLMAGLPNFATYFGRDMLMTALLMQPVWAPEMPEHVIASALGKLAPDGDVSHEEALGGQAIRENAAEYNRLVAAGRLAQARAVLGRLDATRENYLMIDDDFQLPVVAARYFADPRVSGERKRRFLGAENRLARLVANLDYVAGHAAPYARNPIATNLVSFPRGSDGRWISASWRDSRAGYGGGRFAMDVNAIWVPHALESIGTILDALSELGLKPVIPKGPLAPFAKDRAALARAVAAWKGAERHFQVTLAGGAVAERVSKRVNWLSQQERDYWLGVQTRAGIEQDSIRFLALSLDAAGRPIPIVNTDPAMALLLDSLGRERTLELVGPILRLYPSGLFVEALGPLTANDAYAPRDVWETFRRDQYHSPMVVWGRDVNILLAGLARQRGVGAQHAAPLLESALTRINDAVEQSGMRHAELWSYRIDNGRLVPTRYGTSSDVQLWSLTDLAVQYLLNHHTP